MYKRIYLISLIIILVQSYCWAFKITEKKLINGLDVIFIESHVIPLVTVEIVSKNGAFVESSAFNGLSHFYEHMFFKANKFIPDQEKWVEFTRAHGMKWNGSTSSNYVNYYFTMHKKNLMAGLNIMNYSIRFPLFDEVELNREKKVVLSEYDDGDAEPASLFPQGINQESFWEKCILC